MSADHFIQCDDCGTEFVSFFSGAAMARGCSEQCPNCHSVINTPLLAGDINLDRLSAASEQPMIKEYGEDGYVYMGAGYLAFAIDEPTIRQVYSLYDRNFMHAMATADEYYQSSVKDRQRTIGVITIKTMTAYQRLIDDIVLAIRKTGSTGLLPVKGMHRLEARINALRQILDLTADANDDVHFVALQYLYAYRNCIDHGGGVIDQKFIDKMGSIGNFELETFRLGEPVRIDISTALSFLDSLQQMASKLLLNTQALVKSPRCRASIP